MAGGASLVAGGAIVVAGVLVVAGGVLVVSWFPLWLSSVAGGGLVVSWCPRWLSSVVVLGGWWWLPGAGGAPRWLVVAPWQPRPHIHSRTRRRGHATLLSAAALSLKWVSLRIFFNMLFLYLSII